MTIDSFLTLLTQVIFLFVAGSTLFNWATYRTRARLDIALVFLSLAVAILAQGLQRILPALAPVFTLIFLVALLIQPYFLLRLVQYFRPIPTWLQRISLLGLVLVIASFSFSQMAPILVSILAVVYFFTLEGYATLLLTQEARTLRGVLGKRLQLASIGSGLLALIFFLSLGLALVRVQANLPPTSQPWVGSLLQVLAILSGLSYYFGFSPPRALRQTWQFRELYHFLRDTAKKLERDRLTVFEELAAGALRTVGGATALIAGWNAVENRLVIEVPGEFPWQTESLETEVGAISQAWQENRARLAHVPEEVGPDTNFWASQFGARALFIIPIVGSLQPWGMLIIALRYEPLFEQDALDLLTLLAGETASSLDKFALIDELKIMNQFLEQRVAERTSQLEAEILERQRAEEVLKGSENRFRSIVEAAPSAMISVDHAGRINLVNTRARELFGYSKEELLGRPVEILVPERLRNRHLLDRQGFLNQPTSRPMGVGRDLFGVHKDGREIPIEIGLSPYESADGLAVLALIVDISERKQAQAKNTYHARLLRHINDAVIATDPGFNITAWNRAAEKTYGWTAEEVMGRNAAEIMGSGLSDQQRTQAIERLKYETASRSEIIHHRKNGQAISVEANTIALTDDSGKLTGYVSVNRDITERKQAEEKLQRQNQRLKALREIDTAILSSDSVENIIGAALSHIRELIDCQRATLTLIDSTANEALMFDVRTTNETFIPKGTRIPLTPFQDVIHILSQNQPVLMNDLNTLTNPQPQIQSLIQEGLRSLCILPLFSQSKLIGTFGLSSEIPGFFDEDKINLGREVANQVAIAITQNNLLTALRGFNTALEQRVAERTAELSEANTLLQAMLDNIPDQIYFKDLQSRFIRNSRSQATLMGVKDPSEVIGKSDFDFFPHAQRAFEEEQELMKAGKPLIDLEEFVVWPDGRDMWVSTTKVPLRETEGQIIGIMGISRDITERKRFEENIQKLNEDLKQYAAQLRESEEKFSKAFLASPAAMSIARASDGGYIDVNEALARMTGYSRAELLGHTSLELGLVDSEARAKILQAGKDLGFVRNVEIQIHTKSKQTLDVLVSLEQIILSGQICMLTIQYDITERKRAEAEVRRLNQELENNRKDIQSILDSMSTLNAKVALDGMLLFVNKIATQASGLSVDELMKTNFLEGPWWTFDPNVHARVKEAFAQACSGTVINYDEKIFVFGQILTISFSLTPMFGADGRVEYILAEGRDISNLKAVEESLRVKTTQLETANKELESFAYSVSHDLRAPLRAINGFSQALSNKYTDLLGQQGLHYLGRIQANTFHMGQLIDDLLSLSRISRREMKLDDINLTELAREVDKELRAHEPERQVLFEVEGQLEAKGDAGLIRIVLQNLLTNAWKFTATRPSGQAHIQFGVLSSPQALSEGHGQGEQVYYVRDNGVGFDMAFANKLFGAFQRLHSTAEFPGTGIGLATVQRVIHRHGGRIWAEAELEKGATFYFTLGGNHER